MKQLLAMASFSCKTVRKKPNNPNFIFSEWKETSPSRRCIFLLTSPGQQRMQLGTRGVEGKGMELGRGICEWRGDLGFLQSNGFTTEASPGWQSYKLRQAKASGIHSGLPNCKQLEPAALWALWWVPGQRNSRGQEPTTRSENARGEVLL